MERTKVRKWGVCLCVVLVLLAVPLALRYKLQQRHSQTNVFSGVICIGVDVRWKNASGAWVPWIENVVKEYEKAHEDTLLHIRELQGDWQNDAIWPDVVLFSTGVIQTPEESLVSLNALPKGIKPELLQSAEWNGKTYALPAAHGGYAILCNRLWWQQAEADIHTGWPERLEALKRVASSEENRLGAIVCPQRSHYNYFAALHSMTGLEEQYAAFSEQSDAWADFVLDQEYACIVATQWEIKRIQTLQANGAGFEWDLYTDGRAYTDQVLYAGIVQGTKSGKTISGPRGRAIAEVAMAFVQHSAQDKLKSAGAFSVYGDKLLFEDVAGLKQMEEHLRWNISVPNAFAS